jgi:hypothetical protein
MFCQADDSPRCSVSPCPLILQETWASQQRRRDRQRPTDECGRAMDVVGYFGCQALAADTRGYLEPRGALILLPPLPTLWLAVWYKNLGNGNLLT